MAYKCRMVCFVQHIVIVNAITKGMNVISCFTEHFNDEVIHRKLIDLEIKLVVGFNACLDLQDTPRCLVFILCGKEFLII